MSRPSTFARVAWGAALAASTAGLGYLYWRYAWQHPGAYEWLHDGEQYQLLEPRALAVMLVVPLLLLAIARSLADLPWQQRVMSVVLRVAFLALLALGLSRVVRTAETQKVATVFLIDVSDSVPDEALAAARQRVVDAQNAVGSQGALGSENTVRLVTFAQRPRLVPLENADGKPYVPDVAELRHAAAAGDVKEPDAKEPSNADEPGKPEATDGKSDKETPKDEASPSSGTDIQAALQLAYGLFPSGYLRRVELHTDGVETDGDVLAEATRAKSMGIKLFARPYRQPPPGEVAVRGLHVPSKVEIGEPFELVADVYSSRATTAKARLFQGDVINGLDGVRNLDLTPGVNEVRFKSVVRFGGELTYSLKLSDIGEDRFPQNNQYLTTVDVPGRPTILYVEGQPQRASYLASALGAQQFEVDVRTATAFPGTLAELERYDLLILSDVPAEQVSLASQDLIERYVRILGGGFVFAGGESGYGLGGWGHTTVERLLPVRMDVQRRKDVPSVALSLVIDRSGSMTGLPIEMAKAACKATVGTLQGDDLIQVVAFDSTPKRYVKMQPARYRSRIQNEIARIQPGGGTAIFSALDTAYQDISVVQARKKHVILLTDGRAESQGIRDLVQAMIAESITVTTVGLGNDADTDLLRMIADTGGGRYHHVPDPNSLPRIFTRETEMISRQAAVQEWFPVTQTGHADFLRGVAIGAAPLLHGYVATEMKSAPAQQLLASDNGEPILARWRVGLGWAVAWTSDVKNHWAVDWLRWSGFSRFWGQLAREHMRQKHRREIDMRTSVEGGRVRAVVDAFTADERFDNDIEAELFVSGPAPKGQRREYPMRQTAPGRYEADFRLDEYGSFTLKAEHFKTTENGRKRVGVSYGQVSNPYPREYAAFEPDVERLQRAVTAAGGALDADWDTIIDPGDEKIRYQQQLWPRFLVLALLVYFFDLLVRRVRFFDRKFVARRRREVVTG